MSGGGPEIEALGIGRRHPESSGWLFDDVSLTLEPGSSISIVGPSGSGKTLLLRALALLDPLDTGEIRFAGKAIHAERVPEYRSRAIYLHQRPTLVEDRVEASLRRPFALEVHRGRSFRKERIVSMLDELGRDETFLSKPVTELSGGELQIVALLRAIQLDPIFLLLDEPTAALDSEASASVEALVLAWIAESPGSRSIVWVTHSVQQRERLATRSVRMVRGRIQHER